MPLYEYDCQACGQGFEELVFGDEAPACPHCADPRPERRLSVFSAPASRAAGGAPAPAPGGGGCGTCGDPRGPGACALD